MNIVSVSIYPNALAVECHENEEIEHLLFDVTENLKGPIVDTLWMGDKTISVGYRGGGCISLRGEDQLGEAKAGMFTMTRGNGDNPVKATRDGKFLVWYATKDLATNARGWPWWIWRSTILTNIIERCRLANKVVTITHYHDGFVAVKMN